MYAFTVRLGVDNIYREVGRVVETWELVWDSDKGDIPDAVS